MAFKHLKILIMPHMLLLFTTDLARPEYLNTRPLVGEHPTKWSIATPDLT